MMLAPAGASAGSMVIASGGPGLINHLLTDTEGIATPRSLYGWEGPAAEWACHCCNCVNDELTKRCKTCGRSAAYVPPLHFPFFGTMAKALRPGQAIFLLNERGCDVNAMDAENWTPAHLASAYGNIGLLRVLLDTGARLEAQTKRGWRPLHFAAQGGHLTCVELLLSKHAGVSGATKGCLSTPLHVAAEAGYADICRRLLAESADPEARDVMGRTPLHVAAGKGHLEASRALLEAGVEVDALDHDKWVPRQVAEFRGFLEVAAVLAKEKLARAEGGKGGTHGASTALPPAPWHVDIFAQVRKDAARPRKLAALSAVREATYSRYADIYKGDAAETYARAVEASRREKGGLAAYRRRVVSASMDADRYRGFHETPEAFLPGEEGAGEASFVGGGATMDSSESSGGGEGEAVALALLPGMAGPSSDDSKEERGGERKGDGRGGTAAAAAATPEVAGAESGGSGSGGGRKGGGGIAGGGESGGGGAFVDVVRFNNARAKYLRPWDDAALSRPYRVSPLSDWRAFKGGGAAGLVSTRSGLSSGGGGGGLGGSVSTRGGSSSASRAGSRGAVVDEACHKAGEGHTRRQSIALSRRDGAAWGRA